MTITYVSEITDLLFLLAVAFLFAAAKNIHLLTCLHNKVTNKQYQPQPRLWLAARHVMGRPRRHALI